MNFPNKLIHKLNQRIESNSLRSLDSSTDLIDFYSNDYLGFAQSEEIFNLTHDLLLKENIKLNGATGSRLISGNHFLYQITEEHIAQFHKTEKALLFNSGYDANVGFFSAIPQRGDVIFYDELIHASIRDGIQLSKAKAYKFKHNDIAHLQELLNRFDYDNAYIITESVFSMDGDSANLIDFIEISSKDNTFLIVDEAHALGVFGKNGAGLVQELGIEDKVFARITTYGKALGCHGAAILGSKNLYDFLVNFSRSFIYTTGLSPHSVATIRVAYEQLIPNKINVLKDKITHFKSELKRLELEHKFISSSSAIQCCIVSSPEKTKDLAKNLQQKGFNVKPILSPTVPEGQERLRICLHSFNSDEEITRILSLLATFV
ncbi:8-amino-7-oxononanoate synthase [Tenacibaculum sp. SZ-18]|uniref:aminotransferase class I/II-fold pyridoxal phosphate-dependent enzyme n=1 Tax=Tenacibaculum sp. SZ-18 TaxID=754423 RepID=UPI000C2D2860|nr:pyridoxal phosphate-dependent aminotransferase family protein [Tenacibaculum sp. SZ-18]AUC16898.1 8-amino-7-oxononanoate synthase [Tenacibaculum sp. SZ-18]